MGLPMEIIFGFQLATRFRKPTLEEWVHMGEDSSSKLGEQCMSNIPTMVHDAEYKERSYHQTKKDLKKHLRHRDRHVKASGEHGTPAWKLSGTQGTAYWWERNEGPLPPLWPRCNFIHPKADQSLSLNARSCRLQVKRSCRATRMWFPRAQTGSLRG